MSNIYIANAFSLQMLNTCDTRTVRIGEASAAEVVAAIAPCVEAVQFAVGHMDTATLAVKSLLDVNPELKLTSKTMFCRRNLALFRGDVLYVIQVIGGRLPEGCTELPQGTRLLWMKVTVEG